MFAQVRDRGPRVWRAATRRPPNSPVRQTRSSKAPRLAVTATLSFSHPSDRQRILSIVDGLLFLRIVTNSSKSRSHETLSWAPPRAGLPVERREPWELAMHGARAGLVAGLALGVVEITASTLLRGDPRLPFDFAAAIIVGPEALTPAFPLVASLTLGAVIHVLLSIVFGTAFLAGLALTFQLSARPWLMLLYGMLFGVTVWEVDFLAVLPVIAPELTGRLDLATQLWNGIVSYCLVYGPVLAAYVIWVRPGMLDRWWVSEGDSEEA